MVTTGMLALGSRLIGSDAYASKPATATAMKIAMTASGLVTESRVIASTSAHTAAGATPRQIRSTSRAANSARDGRGGSGGRRASRS